LVVGAVVGLTPAALGRGQERATARAAAAVAAFLAVTLLLSPFSGLTGMPAWATLASLLGAAVASWRASSLVDPPPTPTAEEDFADQWE
jgi:hypothetical protein